MARYVVLAGTITFLAPLLCLGVVLFSSHFVPSLLSISTGSLSAGPVHEVPVPQPISLLPSVSSERALNILPLWHGRLDEDVMANPPPPFFDHAHFEPASSNLRSSTEFSSNDLRSSTEFSSNGKLASASGVQDSYQVIKAQFNAQEAKLRQLAKIASFDSRPVHIDAAIAPSEGSGRHSSHIVRERSAKSLSHAESKVSTMRSVGPYSYSHAGFNRDTSFYKAADSAVGAAHFDANLASTIQSRSPRLAHDLRHFSSAILRRLHYRERARTSHSTAAVSSSSITSSRPAAAVAAPLSSLQPLLPATLHHKLIPRDTSFYQAANSRTGIAKFDAQLATEIQGRRPDLSEDLRKISSAILSAPLSSLKPLLPSASPVDAPAPRSDLASSPDDVDSLVPLASNAEEHKVTPSVSILQHAPAADYTRIFDKHTVPSAHFPQQEEAWIHFAASGASFGGDTKEQRDAVKKVSWF
jgi:hypothetical protein